MVKEVTEENKIYYQCEQCGFFYGTKELAEKCEKWCTEHRSCNLEIIKQAVNFQENSMLKNNH